MYTQIRTCFIFTILAMTTVQSSKTTYYISSTPGESTATVATTLPETFAPPEQITTLASTVNIAPTTTAEERSASDKITTHIPTDRRSQTNERGATAESTQLSTPADENTENSVVGKPVCYSKPDENNIPHGLQVM